jgi:glutaredoxin 3
VAGGQSSIEQKMKPLVTIYTSAVCPYCIWAKELLRRKAVHFDEIRIDLVPSQAEDMVRRSGRTSVPQIFVDEHHVGGYDDLSALDRKGELDVLLGLSSA